MLKQWIGERNYLSHFGILSKKKNHENNHPYNDYER